MTQTFTSSPACGSREASEECRSEFSGIGGQRYRDRAGAGPGGYAQIIDAHGHGHAFSQRALHHSQGTHAKYCPDLRLSSLYAEIRSNTALASTVRGLSDEMASKSLMNCSSIGTMLHAFSGTAKIFGTLAKICLAA